MSQRPASVRSVSSLKDKFKAAIPSFGKKSKSKKADSKAADSSVRKAKEEAERIHEEDERADDQSDKDEADAAIALEEQIKETKVDKSSGSKPKAPTTEVVPASIPSSSKQIGSSKNFYPYIWDKYEQCGLYGVRNLGISNYIPNDVSLSERLTACHRVLEGNRYIRKAHPSYLPLAVTLYMAILKQLRVFQVRQAHSANSTAGTQLLTRFERGFGKIDNLIVPNVFRADIEAVAAYKPDNEQVSWLLPFLPDNLGGDAATDIHSLTSAFMHGARPLETLAGTAELHTLFIVPILLDWMRAYVNADFTATTTLHPAGNDPAADPAVTVLTHNYNGHFVPFQLGYDAEPAERVHLAGYRLTRQIDANVAEQTEYLNPLGLQSNAGLEFESMEEKLVHWSTSKFALLAPHASQNDANYSTPQQWFGFSDSFAWMQDLIDNIGIFCRYMGGHVTLGSLDINGSGSCAIFSDVTLNPGTIVPILLTQNARFFTTQIYGATSTLHIYEDDVPARRAYLQKYTSTNARISKRYRIASQNAGISTFASLQNADGARIGPFFNNQIVRNAGNTAWVRGNVGPFSTQISAAHSDLILDGMQDFVRSVFYSPEA